jgi:isoamylase
VVRGLIIDALRYWVADTHVDGFRFDLASILGRGRSGEILPNPPIVERIAGDPVLAGSTLIAEAWDAAGVNQVGRFPSFGRWAEWNGIFRDDVRRFVRGDTGFTPALASRLAGSADLFQRDGLGPAHSINYVTCHDGFTLADLVSYDRKHNVANGEDNRDGAAENFSWNCGAEGPSGDPSVQALRRKQARNLLTLLMLSQGRPMLLAGDEFGRTQRGNNNPYCQDNEISWVDWRLLDENRDLFRFTRLLIAFRRAHPVLRRTAFLTGRGNQRSPRPDVTWHGTNLGEPEWGTGAQTIAMHLAGEHAPEPDCDVYLAANASGLDATFELPAPPQGTRWARAIDTAAPSPGDIADPGKEPVLADQTRALVRARSCVVLLSR